MLTREAVRMKQLPLHLRAAPACSFDSFVVGANGAAVEALRAPALPASVAAPIYLWGAAGAGKTHLLNARARAAQSSGGQVTAFAADQPAPWAWQDGCTLLVLDGCDAFDEAQQHAAFTLFVEAATLGVPVVAAGRLPPVDLPVREDLRTRLGWGLVFHVRPATEPEARDALQREAHRRGLSLPADVVVYLLHHHERDLGSLMAWLDALDDFALGEKRPITVPLLKRLLAERDAPGVLEAPEAPLAGTPDATAA